MEEDPVIMKPEEKTSILIGKRRIGNNEPCFIIAEAGVNHNGDPALAKQLVDSAADAGADAIKFQTFKSENLVTPSAKKADYQLVHDPASVTQFQMLKRLELSNAEFEDIAVHTKKRGLVFLSTAFDEESLALLGHLDVPAYKVPSGEITNFPLLTRIAGGKKPVILSTGMSTLGEVEDAVACLNAAGCTGIIILHCTTCYPAPLESVNLRVMDTLKDRFLYPVGYSDHTAGISVPIAAVARGACVIEKHLTLDRTMPGPDHAASLEPDELKAMVHAIRDVEKALGSPEKKPEACEIAVLDLVRRSVVAAADIPKGTLLAEPLLVLKRPGTGITPRDLQKLVGKRAKQRIEKDAMITWDMVE